MIALRRTPGSFISDYEKALLWHNVLSVMLIAGPETSERGGVASALFSELGTYENLLSYATQLLAATRRQRRPYQKTKKHVNFR
ncbi:hypothetical protein HY632_05040 [Candidatus Uhrbacteria bacterium]|nr:hypothetical protein [Candidatus Uhrbacteria bacterium]